MGDDVVQYTKRYVNDVLVEEKSKLSHESQTQQEGREVPTKITYNGDWVQCQEALKPAKKFLGKMQNTVKLSRGNIQQLWSQRIKLSTGQEFICSVEHSFSKIEIFAGGGGDKKKDIYYACYCDCNFSIGFIIEQTENLDGFIPAYTVAICGGLGLYNVFENILASDFTKYIPGQKVLVMAYNGVNYTCCFANGATSIASGCNPAINGLATGAEDWRTTYRIVPFCAFNIPKWEQTKVVYGDV